MDLDEQRWQAVAGREPAPDFVYGVTTTGVFCRPGCPSRQPLRRNVRFFDDADQARRAGLRACRRCRPDEGGSPALQRVVTVCRAMLDAGGPLPAADLQRLSGVSSRQVGRDVADLLGVSPRAFGQAVRTGTARGLLRRHGQVLDAVFGAAFGSTRGFYDTAAPTLGMAPAAYADGGRGQRLRWSAATCAVGTVLVVAGDLGLTAVSLGDDEQTLLDAVHRELPHAALRRADDELAGAVAAVRLLAEGVPADPGLPLVVSGTAFQARVWSALQRIPAGETRSYAELARDVGAPTAVRAVASACGANRLALVVPCHRVVRSDGSPGGYRWGLAVKRRLLDLERPLSAPGGAA